MVYAGDALAEYGLVTTLYNRCKRWGDMGVVARMMLGLAQADAALSTLMIDATYLKAHRTASSLRLKKGGRERLIGRTKGGLDTQLHGLTDRSGKPRRFFLSAGQLSDYTGAAPRVPRQISCSQIGDMMPIGFDMRLKTKG